MSPESARNDVKEAAWEGRKSWPEGLLRHKGGNFYARLSAGGKTRFMPLEFEEARLTGRKFDFQGGGPVELPLLRKRIAEIESYLIKHEGWHRLHRLHGPRSWWCRDTPTLQELRIVDSRSYDQNDG